MNHIKPKLMLKAVMTVSVITVIVSLLVSASYHYLGTELTITLVAIYAALAFWLHFELNHTFLKKEEQESKETAGVAEPAKPVVPESHTIYRDPVDDIDFADITPCINKEFFLEELEKLARMRNPIIDKI